MCKFYLDCCLLKIQRVILSISYIIYQIYSETCLNRTLNKLNYNETCLNRTLNKLNYSETCLNRTLNKLNYKETCLNRTLNKLNYSETCLNSTLNKPESYIKRTLNKLLMQKIFVYLTCINRTPVYSKHKSFSQVQFRKDSLQ